MLPTAGRPCSGCKVQMPWMQTDDWTQRRSLGTVLRHSMSALHETASGRVCVSQPHNIRRRHVKAATQCVLTKASRYLFADVSSFTSDRVPVPFTRGQTSLCLADTVILRIPVNLSATQQQTAQIGVRRLGLSPWLFTMSCVSRELAGQTAD